MRISVLIPSKRPKDLERLLESLKRTTFDYNSLELIILRDSTDYSFKRTDGLVEIYTTPTGRVSDLFEICYLHATGDWILFGNDDVIFETYNWDMIFKAKIMQYPDKIVLFYPNDEIFKGNLACFPLVSAKAMGIAKGIFPMPYQIYKVDDSIQDIFPINRRIYVPEIIVKHMNLVNEGPGYKTERGIYPNNEKVLREDTQKFFDLQNHRDSLKRKLEACID